MQIPDLLGHSAATGAGELDRGLVLHRAGLEVAAAIGDGVLRVGGPYRTPDPRTLTRLRPLLENAVDTAVETVRWISGFDVPESELDIPLLTLDDPMPGPAARGLARYPADGGVGVLVSNGLGFPPGEFEAFISRPRGGPTRTGRAAPRGAKATLTGPLGRNALCGRLLRPAARDAATRAGLTAAERNPYRCGLIRAVELVHALEEATALNGGYEPPDPGRVTRLEPGPGRGFAAAQSPAGLLYQRYDLLADGTVGAVRLIGADELNRTAVELDLRRAERTARRRDPAIAQDRLAAVRAEPTHNYEPWDTGPARSGTNGPDRAAHPAGPYR